MHYLQMSLEKIFKAYKLRNSYGGSVEKILSGHVVVGKLLSAFINSPHIRMESGMNKQVLRSRFAQFNRIAREIERMAPAVDSSGHPENAEYPWKSKDGIMTPCHYEFPNIHLLDSIEMSPFLKMVDLLIRDFDRISL